MPLVTDDLREALDRILQPIGGQAQDIRGARSASKAEQTLREILSQAFLSRPELALDALDEAARGLKALQAPFLEQLDSLTYVLPVAQTPPTAAPTMERSRVALRNVTAKGLFASPGYAAFVQESSQQLQHHAQQRYTDALILGPTEARVEAAKVMYALEAALATIQERAELIARGLTDAAAAPVDQAAVEALRVRTLDVLERPDPTLPLQVALLRSTFEAVRLRRRLRERYVLSGTWVTEPDSTQYPAVPPYLDAVAGPYYLAGLRTMVVNLGDEQESIQLLPSGAAQLDGTVTEVYTWITDVTATNPGPYSLAGANFFEIFLTLPDGTRRDISVELTEALQTTDEVVAELEAAWGVLGVSAWVEASNSGGDLRVTSLLGATFAIGSGSSNATTGLSATGGFVVTASGSTTFVGAAETYNLTSSNNTLLLQARRSDGTFVQVELSLPTGGAVTAVQVCTAISSRFSSLDLSAFYVAAAVLGAVTVTAAAGSVNRLEFLPCSAASVIGFTPGTVVQGKDDTRTLMLLVNGVVDAAFVPADTYSATSLRDLLETMLADTDVLATGLPGSRTLSFQYTGADPADATMGVDTSGLLASVLGLQGDVDFEASTTRPDVLAAQIRERSKLLLTSVEQDEPEELNVRLSAAAPTQLRVFRDKGSAVAAQYAPTTIQLTIEGSWALQVGDVLQVMTGPNAGSFWTVSYVNRTVLRATGSELPFPTTVEWEGGPDQTSSAGHLLRVEDGPLAGDHWSTGGLTPLDVSLGTLLTLGEVEAPALVGPAHTRLTAVRAEPLEISSVDGLDDLFNRDSALPQHPWLRLPDTSPIVPGDIVEVWAPGTVTSPLDVLVLDVAEDGAVVRVAEGPTTPWTMPYSLVPSAPSRLTVRSYRMTAALLRAAQVNSWASKLTARNQLVAETKRALYEAVQRANPSPTLQVRVLRAADELRTAFTELEEALEATPTEAEDSFTRLSGLLERRGASLLQDHLRTANFVQLFSENPIAFEDDALIKLAEVMKDYLPRERGELRENAVELTSPESPDDAFYYGEEDEGF